jgi:hypothetical protein
LIAVLVLAVLFGGWQAYEHFNMVTPLKRDLQQVEGVQMVNVSSGNPEIIDVQLGPFSKLKNGDLQQTYNDLENQISAKLGADVTPHLLDNRNKVLTQAMESFNPALLQGIDKSNYTTMIAQVTNEAKKQGIQCRITMDRQYIYIQLAKGKYYLYTVMPYTTRQGGAAS